MARHETHETVQQVSDLQSDETLEVTINNERGRIRVTTGDRDDVLIRIMDRYADHLGPAAEVIQDGNRIEVRPNTGWLGAVTGTFGVRTGESERSQTDTGGSWFNFGSFDFGSLGELVGLSGKGRRADFDVTVELPRRATWLRPERPGTWLRVRTVTGEAEIVGVAGRVEATSVSGHPELVDCQGEITVTTASGNASVSRPTGDLSVRTASGDIAIRRGNLHGWSIVSASGDIDLETVLSGWSPGRVQTMSGDVQMRLAMAMAADTSSEHDAPRAAVLKFQSLSGDATVEAPFTREGRRAWRIGPAQARIADLAVQSVSGDLDVRVVEPWVNPAPEGTSSRQGTTWTPIPSHAEPRASGNDDVASAERDIEEAMRAFGGDDAAATPPTPPEPPTPPTPSAPPAPAAPAEPPVPSAATMTSTDEPTNGGSNGDVEPDREDMTDAARLAILLALERGELSVEEAMSRLDRFSEERSD